MTSHLNSQRTTDIKPEMLSGVQNGNGTPHDKYNIRGIAHVRTNRKDDIFMQRQLVQNFTFILERGQGTCSLTKHTRRWAYSLYLSLHAAYSALRHFFFFSRTLKNFVGRRKSYFGSNLVLFSFSEWPRIAGQENQVVKFVPICCLANIFQIPL